MIKNENEIFITEEESRKCLLDGKVFSSSKKMIWYVRKTYKLDFESYIIKCYYNGIRPVCLKTGKDLTFKASKLGPFFHNYTKNAFPRNPHSGETKKKIKEGCEKTFIKKFGVKNVFQTNWCKEKIKNTIQKKYGVNNIIENFNIDNLNELIKQFEISKYEPNYILGYRQKIVSKEYLKNYINIKGKSKLERYVSMFLKFIRTFQPSFPYPELNENLNVIINKIQTCNYDKIYNKNKKEFFNNIVVGNNYLKYYFHSYWKSKFNGNLSPVEAWNNDKVMKQVISYRIGLNNSNEIFDFSLHQLIRGLSARRITISFFSPVLAASIYKTILSDIESPVVLDPCCGFGARLLGFKSIYPNGTYIGCEPNNETYNELQTLIKNANWTNVKIYNCKFEEFKSDINFDLIFTSIPYYTTEIYSNNSDYASFEDWKNKFITSIEKYKNKNCYINIPQDLYDKLGWKNIEYKILKNKSHFNKNKKDKTEYIVKLSTTH